MLKSTIIAAALVAAITTAHACDGYYEAAAFMLYDQACAKLPADFLSMIQKQNAGGSTFVREMLKSAQDSEQADYEQDQKGYCQKQADFVKRAISAYRRHGTRYCF
jgi:hypothetical protein